MPRKIERRVAKSVVPANRTTQLVWAVVALCFILAGSLLLVKWFSPNDASTGTLLVGTIGSAITALLAIVLQSVHVLVNSNTDKLKETITNLEDLLATANETIVDLRGAIAAATKQAGG